MIHLNGIFGTHYIDPPCFSFQVPWNFRPSIDREHENEVLNPQPHVIVLEKMLLDVVSLKIIVHKLLC
jgi:hypothetical protein